MNKLTDLEICKRIAEIEGVSLYDKPNDMTGNLETLYPPYMSYNPLTDDALCFQLMVKHKATVIWTRGLVMMYKYPNSSALDTVRVEFGGILGINKAILLAIIEAHNE